MTVLQVLNFGGEVPSASSRTLPPGSARTARNLHPRVGEFRPLNEALEMAGVTVASGSKALHRLERKADGAFASDMTTGWLAYPEVMSFAKGQINDDLTGRVYFSYDTGTETPPRVMDALGVNKKLGVPAPKAPQVSVIVGDEFTPEEYDGLMVIKTAEVAATVRANASYQLVGSKLLGNDTPGYLNTEVSGVVAPAPVPGGGTSGGGAVVIGGGGGVVVPAAPTQVTLPDGGTYYAPTSPLYLHQYITSGGAVFALVQNVIYTVDGDTYAINGDNLMEKLT